jgi:hypothetical protein
MPRLIDYASRFEFLRRAAFAIVRDRGVGDLSRHAIARELGTSVSTVRRLLHHDVQLAGLALDEVTRRRRLGRWGVPSGSPEDVALTLLRRALPDEGHRIAEELVWWRLVIASAAGPQCGGETRFRHDADWGDGSLREQYQVATLGYADHGVESDPYAPAEQEAPDPLASDMEAHEQDISAPISRVLDLLGVPDPDQSEAVRIRALLDGLSLGVCLGRLTPAHAVATLAHHLTTVRVAA